MNVFIFYDENMYSNFQIRSITEILKSHSIKIKSICLCPERK